MMEAELLIGHLRSQVRNLQSLLKYLENRAVLDDEDYSYSHAKLYDLIGSLRNLERFSLDHGTMHNLRAVWLN